MSLPSRVRTARFALWAVLKPAAREMRHEPTPAEKALWRALRGKSLGVRFRRQHAIDRFIVDFVALAPRLVIEVDGAVHDSAHQQGADAEREAHLKAAGFTIYRFRNEQVLQDLPTVLMAIRTALQSAPPASSDSPVPRD